MNDSSRAGIVALRHRVPAGERFPAFLLMLFAILWVALAIAPRYRQDWLLENLVVLLAVPWLVWCHRRLRLSNLAYAAIFLFLALHEIGAHYTYSEVPYDRWARMLLGISPDQAFGLSRNHYDRVLHFLYGLLITPAAMELLAARASPRGIWRWILPVSFVMSHSVVYELVEWAAALVFGGDLGEAYLGTQGDPWDAQHDMLLAAMGSVLAVLVLRRFPYRTRQPVVQ
jgi:putative membrane protein